MKTIYVIAYDYVQFLEYCRLNKINPYSHLIVYVRDVKQIVGVVNPEVVYYGTWYDRKDIYDLKEMIRLMTRPLKPF